MLHPVEKNEKATSAQIRQLNITVKVGEVVNALLDYFNACSGKT